MHKTLQDMTNEELWALFPIVLMPHNKAWKAQYEKEAQNLHRLLGDIVLQIHHFGSTAVPGLIAKPTVDILLEVCSDTNVDALITTLQKNGYEYAPQPQNPPPHMMFMKGYTLKGFAPEVFHLHVRYKGDHDELYFRDYLVEHTEAMEAYGSLKQSLALAFKNDRDGYTAAKTAFIAEATKKARQAYKGRYQ